MTDDSGGVSIVGVLLKAYRAAKGLSQEQLAARSGLSLRAIGDIERGKVRRPHRDSVELLATALDLTSVERDELMRCRGELRQLHQRILPDDPASASPTMASQPIPAQLPCDIGDFVGRRSELGTLRELLDGHVTAAPVIVAVVGAGGSGKTTLAVHAAHQARDRFPDGQLYVSLGGGSGEPAPDSHDVLGRLLRDLGRAATQIPADPPERQTLYRSMLAGRAVLLVLDDARDATQLAPLLPGSGRSAVIVTSRNRLATLPSTDRLCLTVLDDSAARLLFTRIVGSSRADAEPAAVAQVLAACDGLPLALRIAGTRVVSRPDWTIHTLADRLAQARARLDVLRQDELGLRACFQVSYGQLAPAHARAFRLVGLWPGPDIGATAIAALLGWSATRTEESLDVLVSTHLLETSAPGRYRLHDLLRVYARERAHAADSATARQAALTGVFDHYRHAASVAMDMIAPHERRHRPAVHPPDGTTVTFPDQAAALAWLDAERANLMIVAIGNDAYTLDLSRILWRYLKRRIHIQDALRLHAHALRLARRHHDLLGEAHELRHIGLIHFQLGDYPHAMGHLRRSLVLCRHTDDRAAESYVLCNLGLVRQRMGHLDAAAAHYQQALALGRACGDEAAHMVALDNLGLLHMELGDTAGALDSYQQALALRRAAGDRSGEAVVLNCLGALHHQLGDLVRASDLYHQALDVHRELADPVGQVEVLNELGCAELSAGRPADAVDHLIPALTLVTITGERRYLANVHYGLARAYRQLGHHHAAHDHCQQALSLYDVLGSPHLRDARTLLATLEREPPVQPASDHSG